MVFWELLELWQALNLYVVGDAQSSCAWAPTMEAGLPFPRISDSERLLSELLDLVLHAHGGLDRWRKFNRVRATIVAGGGLLPMKMGAYCRLSSS
jgi:hypothetical protein